MRLVSWATQVRWGVSLRVWLQFHVAHNARYKGLNMEALIPSFFHRLNQDGTWTTVCSNCLKIVANVESEDEIRTYEQDHNCKN
jgi:hypothetical protein